MSLWALEDFEEHISKCSDILLTNTIMDRLIGNEENHWLQHSLSFSFCLQTQCCRILVNSSCSLFAVLSKHSEATAIKLNTS